MTILQADTRDVASNENWEAALSAKDGHPVLALIGIAIVLAIGATLSGPGPHEPLRLFGNAVGLAFLAWGIAYAITIRHARMAWRIATLAIVLLVAMLWAVGILGIDDGTAKRDVAMIAEMRLADDGTVVLPRNADRGPVSRIFIAYAADTNRLKRAQTQAFVALGTQNIADPQALVRSPALLRDCGRFARAKAQSDARLAALRDRLAQLPVDMEKAAIPPALRRSLVAGMMRNLERDQGRITALATITKDQLTEAEAVCSVLAHRRWQARGTMFLFTSKVDRAAYEHHITLWNALSQQEQRIYEASRQQVATGQQHIRDAMR